MKPRKPSAPHRDSEKNAVRSARWFIRNGRYRDAIASLSYALEQATAADVKDAWWKQETHTKGQHER